MKINTHILGLLVVVGLFSLQSCDDESYDIEGSNQNYVYINVNRWTSTEYPQNTFVYEVLRTPIGSSLESGPKIVKVGVRSTKVASKDITVTLDIDNCASIGEFSSFPDGVKVTLDKKELVIPAGSMLSSDSVTIEIEDGKWSEFVNTSYLLPLKVTSVSNAALSETHSSAYLAVSTSFTNCVPGATSVEGTLISDRSAWTATNNGVDVGTTLFDGNTRTYPSQDASSTVIVNLNGVYQNITGIRLQYYSRNYSLSSAAVYTSETGGEDYEYQGNVTFSRATPQYIRFYGAVSARYVKLELLPYSSGYGIVLSEFDMYQNE